MQGFAFDKTEFLKWRFTQRNEKAPCQGDTVQILLEIIFSRAL